MKKFRAHVAKHAAMLRASIRQHPPPVAHRSALALLYCGSAAAVKADFAAGSAGLRQLQLALAHNEPAVRLAGARALAHLFHKRHILLDPAPAPGAGLRSGGVHSFAELFGSEEDSDVCFEIEGRTLVSVT